MKDLYSILNIQKSSNNDEIKKAYRKLAFQYHPDKNKSNEAIDKYKDISEAYDILTDRDKRRIYDNFGYDILKNDIQSQFNPLELFQSLFNVDFTKFNDRCQ